MAERGSRAPSIVALGAAIFGLIFAALSTADYAALLDRGFDHTVHCSLIPGVTDAGHPDSGCRTALYSAYSAILREKYWGGVPIALFALGSFGFYAAFALYLALLGAKAPRRAHQFFSGVTVFPLLATIVMFTISATKLGTFCKTCVGIYLSSVTLFLGAAVGMLQATKREPLSREPRMGMPLVWLAGLGLATVAPAFAYTASMPSYAQYLSSCEKDAGAKLLQPKEPHNALLSIQSPSSVRPVTMFIDPLCPTCRAFHQRLLAEDMFDKLDVTLALFPLDSDCNWMLSEPLHPGACVVARTVLCAGKRTREVLEWSYEHQDDLKATAKTSKDQLKAKLSAQWGPEIMACADARSTVTKLNQHLQFAAANQVQVSTPQLFLGDKRLCDEDTDLGLRYAMSQLAPEVLK